MFEEKETKLLHPITYMSGLFRGSVKVQNGWWLQNGWLGVDPIPNDPMLHS